jgi:beta-lactamase regulating signal transducer with metallopeptidase domain
VFDAIARACSQGAVLAAVIWILLAVWRRPSPAIRARLWLIAAAKFLLVLLFVIELPILQGSQNASSSGSTASAGPAAFDGRPWILAIWALGALVVLSRTLLQSAVISKLAREARPADQRLVDLWASIGRSGADIRVHTEAPMPMVVGLIRPIVLLPEVLARRLDEDELRMIFAHENAHLLRRDALGSLLMCACFTLFYFHPLVWLVQREWRHDREAACDADAMTALGSDAQSYGRMLLKVASASRMAPPLALSAAPSFRTLHRRINDMKNSSKKDRGNALWSLLALIIALGAAPLALVEQRQKPVPEPKSDNLSLLAALPAFESATPPTTATPSAKTLANTRLNLPSPGREKTGSRHASTRVQRPGSHPAPRIDANDSQAGGQVGSRWPKQDGQLPSEELGGTSGPGQTNPAAAGTGGLGGGEQGGSTGGSLGGSGGGGAGGLGGGTGGGLGGSSEGRKPRRTGGLGGSSTPGTDSPGGDLSGDGTVEIKQWPSKKEGEKSQ